MGSLSSITAMGDGRNFVESAECDAVIPYLDALDLSSLDRALAAKCQDGVVSPALAHLKKAGYQVHVSRTLADLRRFWDAHNGAEGLTRSSAFDPRFQTDVGAQGIFLEDPTGELVGTVWRRSIPLTRHMQSLTLKQALEGLFIFYANPLDASRRETCVVECDIADDIKRCTISYGGALWIHPNHKGLFKSFSLLSRVLALSVGGWDYYVLLTSYESRFLALDHFPIRGLLKGVTHAEPPSFIPKENLIGVATYQDAVNLVMRGVP